MTKKTDDGHRGYPLVIHGLMTKIEQECESAEVRLSELRQREIDVSRAAYNDGAWRRITRSDLERVPRNRLSFGQHYIIVIGDDKPVLARLWPEGFCWLGDDGSTVQADLAREDLRVWL